MLCAACRKELALLGLETKELRGQTLCMECYEKYRPKEKTRATDPVDHPAHYNAGKRETIDVLDDMGVAIPGAIFNIVKYLSRFQHKHATPEGQLEDLRKAQLYMNWLVEKHTPPTKEVKDEQASHS